MKYLFILSAFLIFFCENRFQKKSVEEKSTNNFHNNQVNSYLKTGDTYEINFYKDSLYSYFDFKKPPLYVDNDYISNYNTLKYEVNPFLSKLIRDKDHYYKLVNYSDLNKTDNYRMYTVYGNYDYYSNIILITTNIANDSLIDYLIVASIIGDSDYVTEIDSKVYNLDSIVRNSNHIELNFKNDSTISKHETDSYRINSYGEILKN